MYMWRSEDSFSKLALSTGSISGIELRSSDLAASTLYPVSHLEGLLTTSLLRESKCKPGGDVDWNASTVRMRGTAGEKIILASFYISSISLLSAVFFQPVTVIAKFARC